MNSIDVIALAMFAFSCIAGFIKGFLRKVLGVVSFIVGLLAGFVYYKRGAGIIQASLVFTATTIVLNISFWGLGKFFHKEGARISFKDRLGGAAIGACEGLVHVVAMLVLLYLGAGVLSGINPRFGRALDESMAYARFVALNNSVKDNKLTQAQRIVESLRGSQPALTIDPKIAAELKDEPAIKDILEDKELVERIQNRDYGRVLSNPKVLRALQDKELLKKLTQKGIIKASDIPQNIPQNILRQVPHDSPPDPSRDEFPAVPDVDSTIQ